MQPPSTERPYVLDDRARISGVTTSRQLHHAYGHGRACRQTCRGQVPALEHFAGWDSHPLESAAFSRRTPRAAAETVESRRCTDQRVSAKSVPDRIA